LKLQVKSKPDKYWNGSDNHVMPMNINKMNIKT
jgi:hypothetical protein